jgi:hypothetical protein
VGSSVGLEVGEQEERREGDAEGLGVGDRDG